MVTEVWSSSEDSESLSSLVEPVTHECNNKKIERSLKSRGHLPLQALICAGSTVDCFSFPCFWFDCALFNAFASSAANCCSRVNARPDDLGCCFVGILQGSCGKVSIEVHLHMDFPLQNCHQNRFHHNVADDCSPSSASWWLGLWQIGMYLSPVCLANESGLNRSNLSSPGNVIALLLNVAYAGYSLILMIVIDRSHALWKSVEKCWWLALGFV